MFEENFKVTVKGIAPLLANRFSFMENDGRVGKIKDPKIECETTVYKTKEGLLYQPAEHFEASMTKAATNFKIPGQGKKSFKDAFKGGIFVEPLEIIHKIQKWEPDIRPVVIQRARVPKGRAKFVEWELEFTIKNIDERISGAILKQILEEAGRYFGVGDYRPKFGRFEVINFEKV
jgi:hypothetical protein